MSEPQETETAEPEQPPEVYKVIGAPGTGKTTRVVGNPELPDVQSLVMENLQEYPLEDQMIVTYTNAGVDEAADRLERILNTSRNRIDARVTTIHSQCYHAIGVNQNEVVSWWNKQQFCNKHDLTYGNDGDDGDIMSADHDEGHALFQIYEWCKNNMVSLKEWQKCPAPFPGEDDPLELMLEWEQYKLEGGQDKKADRLIQFCDMIDLTVRRGQELLHDAGYPNIFGDNPNDPMETFEQTRHIDRFDPDEWRGKDVFIDTRVLYVDEVQDLYPLQWAWYLMNKLVCEKVYIGGDDDQTIYGWAGANPNFMLDEEGDFEVLDKTYRIPENIWDVCDGVIRQVDKRQEKEVTPHGEGGEVIAKIHPNPRSIVEHLLTGECMVLFRANHQVDQFREILHEAGIPYNNMSTHPTWKGDRGSDLVPLRDALVKIDEGDELLDRDEIDSLKEHAERDCPSCRGDGCKKCNHSGTESMLNENSSYTTKDAALSTLGDGGEKVEDVKEMFDLSHPYRSDEFTAQNFISQTSVLNYYEKQAIQGNISRGNTDMYPDRVRVGTIHSSKGKEAETVVLATDSTQRIIENMLNETRDEPDKTITDAERRVYYVGMTRASEKLVLAQGLVSRDHAIQLSNLLGEFESDDDEWAVNNSKLDSGW